MDKKEAKNNLKLRSEEVQEILTNPPVWIVRWGITLIFIFICIILSLSFLIKYPDFVQAKVLITTKQPTETVIARASGAIDKIFIENRDTVKSGKKLAILRNTADFEDIFYLKNIIDSIPLNLKNFHFPFEKTTSLMLGEVNSAYLNFEKSYINYFLLKDLDPYSNQLGGDRASLVELKKRLKNQITQKELLEEEYKLKQKDFEREKSLFEKGVISQKEYELKQLEILQMKKNVSAMSISISQITEAISIADQNLKNTHINKQEDNTRYSSNLSQSYDLLKEAIRKWEYTYVLSSSINGVIGFQDFWGRNQFVDSGTIVFSILPTDTSTLIGKLLIPAQNAGKVTVGQKVFVKLDNYPYQQYGTLIGKVSNLSITPNSDSNYTVYISLPNGTETSYHKSFNFTQELLGNAEIITEDLSVAERIFYKFKDLFEYH